MIFVHDRGRMANNILQYGHVYAWGREHGRKTMSMRFAYKYPYFHICDTKYHNFATYVFAKYAAKWGLIPMVTFSNDEAQNRCNEDIMLQKRMMVVTGWEAHWYDLFLKYKSEILELFAFRPEIEEKVVEAMNHGDSPPVIRSQSSLLTEGTVPMILGVHIRRGDYATFYNGKFFFSDEQYVGVIRRFLALHPDKQVRVFICGNDPKLDKDYYRRELPACEVVFPDGNPGEDLCLLSHCDYLIGAPSTFSLVAAMYHDRPLYWMMDADAPLSESSFRYFDDLFQHIL